MNARRRYLSRLKIDLSEGRTSSVVTVTRTGSFSDRRYGRFEITPAQLDTMVRNFDARTYGQDIFVDVAHRPDDGAAGRVTRLMREGDRLRAQVEWTPYGIDAVRNRGYAYLSAEYVEDYQDNESGARHGALLMGAGLTVRPVIKRLDPIELSEASGDTPPTLLHPELLRQITQELQAVKNKHRRLLAAALAALTLAEPVRQSILSAYDQVVASLGDDEAPLKALAEQLADTGKQLVGHSAPITLQVGVAGLTTEQVQTQVDAALAPRLADDAIAAAKLASNRTLLADTIMAAAGIDEPLRKELAADVTDLVTGDMSEAQVKALAMNQIAQGNKLVAARQLAGIGFALPGQIGQVRVVVDPANPVKSLQEHVDKRLGFEGEPAKRALSAHNLRYTDVVLAKFDQENGRRLHEEAKRLAAGDSVVSDVAIPAIYERTVIREALYQLVGLSFVDVSTHAFSATALIPYSYRDTTAAGIGAVRKYEGQSVARAAIKQALETAYPIPQKLAFEVSDELRYLAGNGQIDFSVEQENARNAARIVGEDMERLIFDELLNASDRFSTVAVTSEATATANGTNKIFVLDQFPVVRPRKIFDLQGNQVGSTLYPITVLLNSVAIVEYDGTGTQSAGTYYSMNHNLGEITFVNQLGVPVAPTNTHPIVVTYTYTTNVQKFDTDLGSLKTEEKWDDFLYRFGLRKNVVESDRYYMANMGLMSGTVQTQVEQARTFSSNWSRPGTDLMQDGNIGRIKDVAAFKTRAPGLAMADSRVIVGERGSTRFRMMKPWAVGPLQDQKDANGRFTGKKEAYGDQFIAIHTPQLLLGAYTSMVLYSAAARIDRAS